MPAHFDIVVLEDTQERVTTIEMYANFSEEEDIKFWLLRHCKGVENMDTI